MAYTTPSTWVAGEVLTAAQLNEQLRDNIRFLHGPPTASVGTSTSPSIANDVWRAIPWQAELWDTDSLWSSTSSRSFKINTPGKYLVTAIAEFTDSTAGSYRGIGLRIGTPTTGDAVPNRGRAIQPPPETGSAGSGMTISNILSLTSTQFVQVCVLQNSGGALDLSTGSGSLTPTASILWVSS